jgi:hypothetical protein
MTVRSLITGGIAAAVLAACSTAPPAGTYVKVGASAEQVARDRAECAATAAASDNRSVTLTAADRDAVDTCMRARGYVLTAQRR